jgi:riboflavin synthase
MFTGIVQDCAKVVLLEPTEGGARLKLEFPAGWELAIGESCAVNGCCLTALPSDRCAFDLSRETLARTSLGAVRAGDRVNLERALKVGDTLGGHFMAGHVDGLARVVSMDAQGEGAQWRISAPKELMRLVASKGSVALDGVSLTPFAVTGTEFSVAFIPHTLVATNLGAKRPGDVLNLEVDLVARYLERLLETGATPA